ncbi:tribbles homolog 2-like [Saccoglossus kowalevskii]|uniref:Tribbles homolog 2-like n=1 Tax=Saccoglossus kowalevskii TaxID=10224 RepID=A0ABM0H1S9_SACKO|nr:PREDICTED: tribbles homolog 2-like [Saccoglossus kowalevskii]
MNIQRSTPIQIQHGPKHFVPYDSPPDLTFNSISPNLQANSPPQFTENDCTHVISKIGRYILVEQLEKNQYKSIDTLTQGVFLCKVFEVSRYQESLAAYFRLEQHENINHIVEILLGDTYAYVFFEWSYGDMHSYVRSKRRIKEEEASRLFYQIASAVAHCHESGIVLRDLKLRKFVFKDKERTSLKLESLEDTYVLDNDDDSLTDKHGCPAYVSPEILNANCSYSGRSADVWSLGVMLYTMLVGRYPFHDTEPGALFNKIRRGKFSMPESQSSKARCLARSIMQRDPAVRLTAREVLDHPWFHATYHLSNQSRADRNKPLDQMVPDMCMSDDSQFFS